MKHWHKGAFPWRGEKAIQMNELVITNYILGG
jgi:hypothetical protein